MSLNWRNYGRRDISRAVTFIFLKTLRKFSTENQQKTIVECLGVSDFSPFMSYFISERPPTADVKNLLQTFER